MPEILSWDWRQQPDLDALGAALRRVSGGAVNLHKVNTGSDEYAIVLAAEPLDGAQVAEAYRRHCYGEED